MSSRLFSAFDKKAAGVALLVGLAAILGALASERFGGLVPCELCLGQRQPYYLGLPVLAAILLLWNRLPIMVWYIAMAVVLAVFVWSTYLGIHHAGVEWGFWPGPTACTGTGGAINFNDLSNINATRVVPCDAVQFRVLGISLAGLNAVASLLIAVLVAGAMLWQWRHRRTLIAA